MVAGHELTHVDERGAARMVDVSAKDITVRSATASGFLSTTPEVIGLLRGEGVPKGDALAVARVAGIQAAKRTPDLVPLCHPIAIHGVTVDLEVTGGGVSIVATVRTADRTGVEMEALTCVAVAGLTLIDMIKAVDRAAEITDVRVEKKAGGRSGTWCRGPGPSERGGAVVITASTRAAAGFYPDRAGSGLSSSGAQTTRFRGPRPQVVPDGEPVDRALRDSVGSG